MLKRLAGEFIRFFLVGLVWTIVNIYLMWLAIDILGLFGWLGSTLVTILVLIGKYYSYIWIKLIQPKFMRFLAANFTFPITINIINIFEGFSK